MSKVELAGPKALLPDVLSLLQRIGVLQIEPSAIGFVETKEEAHIGLYSPDKDILSERFFLEDLKSRIEELFSYLPALPLKSSYIEPQAIIDTISDTLRRHLAACKQLHQTKETLNKELSELSRYSLFLDAIDPLLDHFKETPDVDFIGLTLKDPEDAEILRKLLSEKTGGRFELLTSTASDATTAGLIIVAKGAADMLKNVLYNKNIPELSLPQSLKDLSFIEKLTYLRKRTSDIQNEMEEIDMRLNSFSMKWSSIYMRVKDWIDERLSVLKATASVFETKMCFFIYGWMASADVAQLRMSLDHDFTGKVMIAELEIHEEDFDRMPVILKNPPYFQPFELFTRILPLPRYTSYDPTPFIALFLPLFFGMILGDAGYGFTFIIISPFVLRKYKKRKNIQDAVKILVIVSAYSIFFGILYGEYFGELGYRFFGLQPLLIERRTSIIPMLYFAVTVGVVHILLGGILGIISAFRKKTKKEVFFRVLQLLFIICLLLVISSLFGLFPSLLVRPVILAIIVLAPFLLFTGGLLAPLELIRNIGNIISYARIMAIGLTSVFLAFVANRLAGMTGDIVLGIVVAVLLHLLNMIIGIFSPTIHSLRLHYVEFFSKFIESGGRKFEPLKKEGALKAIL